MSTNPERDYKGKHRKQDNRRKLSALDWAALALGFILIIFILTVMFASFTGAVL